ncbi:TetR/AcrR family transcriptional regulator [Chitinophaga sancti]|uniref:TetR/AcrR family transcriptional regulator n=1 Tax=Chitinophaga sancti TaxID=1004 RepID=A0A1K1MNN1_9BACT|nr:TetR/AcrR family transcriptional regulator [Chitinophaga sancti]WQD62843.1 TetR/AcrR family transcriptional regulator [Chitinophaga sancti]WQG91533.1 TetR/AcrR family transcriptional regulator [Chitinophaga sancti]SFW24780.1 transcriptional regulator, TetR family [Chitinophaga sancti]
MQDTKDKIVGLADQLIKTKGFNAFSYKEISDPLAIKNAAVHYYFPSKADLGMAVLQQEFDSLNIGIANWENLTEDQQLRQLIASFEKKCSGHMACIMGSLSPDYNTLPANMQERLQQFSAAVIEWVTRCLDKGREKGIFSFKGAPEDRALMIVSNLLASLLLSRVMGESAFEKISKQLLDDIL